MSLRDKILKASTSEFVDSLDNTKVFDTVECPTPIPMLNLAISGSLKGGLKSGITVFAGPSKHFKTMYGLVLVSAFLKKHGEDAVCIFLDSEFGASKQYFKNAGIDTKQVIHVPVTTTEELRVELANQLSVIDREDKVIIFMDSIGNLASKKETEDAKDDKSATDMTRAKVLKSVFRIITPHLTLKDIPFIGINHTYQTLEMFSKQVMGGGTGTVYSSNDIFFIGKAQNKEGTELLGYDFKLNVEKSRTVKEKSVFPITVNFKGGISKYTGLLDLALEMGYVIKPTNVSYQRCFLNKETGELVPEEQKWRRKETDSAEFWDKLLNDQDFNEAVEHRYKLDTDLFVEQSAEVQEMM